MALSVSLSWTPEAFAQAPNSSDSSEYLIKAGFIFNFAKFVEWPATAFAQPDSPIVIGILGTDPFGTIIDQIVQNKKIGARGFVVKRLKWGTDVIEREYVAARPISLRAVFDLLLLTRSV